VYGGSLVLVFVLMMITFMTSQFMCATIEMPYEDYPAENVVRDTAMSSSGGAVYSMLWVIAIIAVIALVMSALKIWGGDEKK